MNILGQSLVHYFCLQKFLVKVLMKKTSNLTKKINYKKPVLTTPVKLNAAIKFTFSDMIKLTLQHKRLECKQLEEQIYNMKKALDNDSHIVSPELSTDFQKLFSQFNEKDVPPFYEIVLAGTTKIHNFVKSKLY